MYKKNCTIIDIRAIEKCSSENPCRKYNRIQNSTNKYKNNQSAKETGRNQEKIKNFFDFDVVELTKEFIHKKICKIYVEYIEKNHAKLKINFHLDLKMSKVDKKVSV